VKLAHLTRFVAVAEELHFPRAAERLGIPLASLYTSVSALEAEVGAALFGKQGGKTTLTGAGVALLPEAHKRIAAAPAPPATAPRAGGKAKAAKGKGRAPVVKGQPKPYKKRQGR
jgi:DNA-binding transcriptional LysR family regulator